VMRVYGVAACLEFRGVLFWSASVPDTYLVCTSLLSTSLIVTWLATVTVTGSGEPVLPSVTAAGSLTVMVGASFWPLMLSVMVLRSEERRVGEEGGNWGAT